MKGGNWRHEFGERDFQHPTRRETLKDLGKCTLGLGGISAAIRVLYAAGGNDADSDRKEGDVIVARTDSKMAAALEQQKKLDAQARAFLDAMKNGDVAALDKIVKAAMADKTYAEMIGTAKKQQAAAASR